MHFDERLVEGKSTPENEADHKARYTFAGTFCANKAVLDVACGTGYGSEMLCQAGASRVVAGDSSPEAMNEAKNRGHTVGSQCVMLDAEHLPFRSGRFDLSVSFETL